MIKRILAALCILALLVAAFIYKEWVALSKEHWGNGYATEAAKEALKYAFTTLNLNEVISFKTLANDSSKAVM